MKSVVALCIAVCTFATFCTQKDTEPAKVWPRTVQPRLTGAADWQECRAVPMSGDRFVEQFRCAVVKVAPADCDAIIETHEQALGLLTLHPPCTDAALSALERFARVDPNAMSDVVAAYIVRAQRQDRPSDLLRALEASDHAIAAAPQSPAAHFNRALAQEALGFNDDAIASWNAVIAKDRTQWAREAREHRDRLTRARAADGAAQWARVRSVNDALPLVEPFPSAALKYLEEQALGLPQASILARAISARLGGDPYAVELVDSFANALVQKGYRAYRNGSYEEAAALLERGGSPLALRARLSHITAVSYAPGGRDRAIAMLAPLEREARERGYRHLLVRIQWMRAFALAIQGRHLESLTEYEQATEEASRLRDGEALVALQSRMIGGFRVAGQHELAWRSVFPGWRYASSIVEARERLMLLGESAEVATELGYPRIALRYLDVIVALHQRALAAIPPEDLAGIAALHRNLAIALRLRARTALLVDRRDAASADLAESIRLLDKTDNRDQNVLRSLRGRAEEVLGQSLLATDANGAAAAFSRSLDFATDDYRTFRASLFVQRAQANQRAGKRAEAERDLRLGLEELQKEETRILQGRTRGEHEELWSAYFARFRQPYELLVGTLIDDGRAAEAFSFAERARAFELMDLVRPYARDAFPSVDGRVDLHRVQRELPAGTFLLEYMVLEDRTYTWVISRDSFRIITQRANRDDIERWSAALQEAARQRDEKAFEAGLYAPYDQLIAAPLAAIAGLPNGRRPRLVFIPDGAMHGLPFSALRLSAKSRYLIQDHPVAVAGSATLYVFSLHRDRELARNRSILIVGDPAFSDDLVVAHGLERLPRAQGEAERIRDLYKKDAETLIGDQATPARFLSRARVSGIVHVAAHAISNADAPTQSLLLLAESEEHAGTLDAKDLLTQLKLHETRLVALSACSSAGGLPVGPEGVAPLVRPLLAAGVPAVIGSLWDVEDATAEELMVSFHRHYRQGSDAAVALQAAQTELLGHRNPGLRSVFAWAAFQVVGKASSPFAAPATHGGTSLGIHSQASLQRHDRLRPQ
ncbi:MAG TPA: CHAT domain-containing protein [Thermoanaerobaculia bacterium]|nr:CHAT domain-containing protein [Thermoanaerobaculia bacterium]